MADDPTALPIHVPGKAQRIVSSAMSLETKLRKSTYLEGGKTSSAFDCSYFVYLVIKDVFPDYDYLSSSAIISSALFEKIPKAEPGAVIYFPPSTDQWWHQHHLKNPDKKFPAHVAIVLNDQEWVGRQTSSLGRVSFGDKNFWGTRATGPSFYRFKGVKASDTTYLQSKSTAGR